MSDEKNEPAFYNTLIRETLALAPRERQDTDARMLAYSVLLSACTLVDAIGKLGERMDTLVLFLEERERKRGGP